MLKLLIVTVLGVGGPHGFPPPPIPHALVQVARHWHPVAHGYTGPKGRYHVRLRRGHYRVRASLEGRPCEARAYTQTRHVGHLTLYCPIK